MNKVDIRGRFPRVYDGFVEIDKLSESEQQLFEQFQSELNEMVCNQWVLTATPEGLDEYERMFNIASSPSDSIEFRRYRIINRFSASPPYTYRFLINKLNSFLGAGNYSVVLNNDAYEILFTTHIGDRGKIDELYKTLVEILPANLVKIIKNDILCVGLSDYYVGQCATVSMSYQLSCDFTKEEIIDSDKYVGGAGVLNASYELN